LQGWGAVKREMNMNPNQSQVLSKCAAFIIVKAACTRCMLAHTSPLMGMQMQTFHACYAYVGYILPELQENFFLTCFT
jgi:hypothetical protein